MAEIFGILMFKIAAVFIQAILDLLALIVFEVLTPLGYRTARFGLPLLSFGRLRVQPASPRPSWWPPLQRNAGEPIEVHPSIAALLGASLWLAALAGLALLVFKSPFP